MPTTWTTAAGVSTTWSAASPDFKALWGDWATYTWGAIASSGFSWAAMVGLTFVNTGTPVTTWTATT